MDEAVGEFLKQGLGYVISVILGGVIVYLYREIKGKDANIAALQDKLLNMALAHADTNKELAQQIVDTVGTLNELFSNPRKRRN